MSTRDLDISVIVPVVDHPLPLVELYQEYSTPLEQAGRSFEFVFAAHPGHEHDTAPLKSLMARHPPVRLIEFGQGVSETALLKVAATNSRGRIIITLPAYQQVEPAALLALVDRVEQGADLAVARRWPRRDSWINRAQNRLLHVMLGRLAGGRLHDVACGVRAFRPKVLEEARVYGDFARFLPLLALRDGFVVDEVPSGVHRSAMRGRMYGPGVYVRRLIDVVGLTFLLRFTDKPLRFFGLIGFVLAALGALICVTLFVERQFNHRGIADRPFLLLGVLILTLGVQAVALGLIGEMIVHLHAARRSMYRLKGEPADERAERLPRGPRVMPGGTYAGGDRRASGIRDRRAVPRVVPVPDSDSLRTSA
jgi:hypothetical protein